MRRPRRPRSWVLTVVVLGVAASVAALVRWVPADLAYLTSGPRPSPVAGQALPAVGEAPAARIAVAGDTGTGDEAVRATARRMEVVGRGHPYDALVLLGDLVYEEGEAALVERVVTEPFAPLLAAGADLVPVLGNHDYESGEQQRILASLGRSSPWYVEEIGPVHVVVLDSNRVHDPDQTRWLRETLARPRPPGSWTVAAMHHPPYSAGYHGSDLEVRRTWGPLFEAADVALVLAGHDHDYQRSSPRAGVTYVVSGAGAKLRRAGHGDFTEVSASTLHYLDLLAYDDRLTVRAVDQAGRLVDAFTLRGP